MGFNLLIFASDAPGQFDVHDSQDWPRRLKELIPGITVDVARSTGEAMELIQDADAAYGDIRPDLFARARKLRWIACPAAGPRAGYYHQALVDSDVIVTNVRGIYSDYISAHIMAFLLSFARDLPNYFRNQLDGEWAPRPIPAYLPESTALIVGVGGIANAEDAWARIRAGASLVQLYSALVYEGPGLARRIVGDLERLMRRDGFAAIAEAVGSE
mgnify:CR=1 FL=1